MESTGAPPKQKRRPRKHKPKQQQAVQEVIVQVPAVVPIPSKTETNKENIQQQEPGTPLIRHPSKRHRKRNKGSKSDNQGQQIQQISLEEIFPGTKVYALENQTVQKIEGKAKQPKEGDKGSRRKENLNFVKNQTIENIEAKHIFPVIKTDCKAIAANAFCVEDIRLEDIFPSVDSYSFENNALPRKVNIIRKVQKVSHQRITKVIPGIEDISLQEIFPIDQNQVKTPLEQQTMNPPKAEKSREEVLAEREAKKAAKAAGKNKNKAPSKPAAQQNATPLQKSSTDSSISEKLDKLHISEPSPKPKANVQPPAVAQPPDPKQLSKAERKAQFEAQNPALAKPKPAATKAERRAVQDAQRAAKAEAQAKKTASAVKTKTENAAQAPVAKKEASPKKLSQKSAKSTASQQQQPHMVKLFNHLYTKKFAASEIVNSNDLHPAITKLGLQYAEGIMAGSKARCLAFLQALMRMIKDYETPPEKEFSRGFEEALNPNIAYLQKCRPFSVSMTNALKYIKMYTRQLNVKESDSDQKNFLLDAIDTYVRDQIEKAEEAISISVQDKIYDGDVILTYGCSSLIKHILEEAKRRQKKFRVVIVDSRPRNREHEMLRQLVAQGIDCTCVLINAISYVMPEVTKVLLSAHALLANGCVMSRVGTAQIALVAKSYNVPVLVCCETHKFSERVQTDAFVYNEIGNPDDLILTSGTRENQSSNPLADWESIKHLTPLNLHYDVTPPELVTAVVTEVAILPCTSVPVILRIKPSEVGY